MAAPSLEEKTERGVSAKLDRKKLSAPALRAFFNITSLWGLSVKEQTILLGGIPSSTYHKWKSKQDGVTLPQDTLERISYILGIYKALQILFPKEEAADSWIKKPNTAAPFGGKSALERMLSGQVSDLYVVRQYLDAWRGGWA